MDAAANPLCLARARLRVYLCARRFGLWCNTFAWVWRKAPWLLVAWVVASRARSRVTARHQATSSYKTLQSAARRATIASVEDRTAVGSGLTVKYLVTFDGGERALFKPLRSAFTRVGRKGKSTHLEEPLGEVAASAVAAALGVAGAPPSILASLPAELLANATLPSSAGALASRCPRYVSPRALAALGAAPAALAGCAPTAPEPRGDARRVPGVLVRWEPRGLDRLPAPARWYLRLQGPLCAGARRALCPLRARERRAWSDLEALDAVLGNYDRPNNVFLRGGALAPLDHNHVLMNLTRARASWRWCDPSPRVAAAVAAAAARRLPPPDVPCPDFDGTLLATFRCTLRASAADDDLARRTARGGDVHKFRHLDTNAAAYEAHLASCGVTR